MSGPPDESATSLALLCEKVASAVAALTGDDTPPSERSAADQYLHSEFPNNPLAFAVLDAFLCREDLPHTSHFMAANQLKRKIVRHYWKIPESHHSGIADALMRYCQCFAQIGRAKSAYANVVTQLCLALAYFFIQKSAWPDPISRVIAKWHSPVFASLLLEYLTIHAEEVMHWTLPLGDTKRLTARKNLESHSESVLQLLEELYTRASKNISLQKKVFACFNRWILLMSDMNTQLMGASRLTDCLFDALRRRELFAISANAICRLLRLQLPNSYVLRRDYFADDCYAHSSVDGDHSEDDTRLQAGRRRHRTVFDSFQKSQEWH